MLGRQEYLLVPRGFDSSLSRDQCDEYLRSLRRWFVYPAKLPCRADPLDPAGYQPVYCRSLCSIERVGSWLVLRRISNTSTAAPVRNPAPVSSLRTEVR